MEDIEFVEFVRSFKKGDQSKFDAFYEATKKRVFYNIFSLTKSHEISEDLLQDTYVQFLKTIDKVDENKSIVGYLMVLSRNLTLDYFKKNNRMNYLEDSNQEFKEEDSKDLDKSILVDELNKILKDKEFEIFILHSLNDLSFEEIASLIHRPLGTVLWSYQNSLKKIRKELKYE